jgi:hypothetical protein
MAISIKRLDLDRDIYSIEYDETAVHGDTVEGHFHNHANGDKSVYAGSNDGSFIVTVSKGYKGSDNVTVTGSDSGEEQGEVHFGG